MSFVVKEREVKAKHQQQLAGMQLLAYWSSTWLFDSLSYLVPAMTTLALIAAFDIDAFLKDGALSATLWLLLLFGPAVASFTYCVSFMFSSHSSALIWVLFLNFLTGLALMITSFVLGLIESTQGINFTLKYFFRLLPGFCLGDGLLQMSLCQKGQCPRLTATGYDMGGLIDTPMSPQVGNRNFTRQIHDFTITIHTRR